MFEEDEFVCMCLDNKMNLCFIVNYQMINGLLLLICFSLSSKSIQFEKVRLFFFSHACQYLLSKMKIKS